MKCPSCSRMLLDSATFCPYCGCTDLKVQAVVPLEDPGPLSADDDDEDDAGSTMVMRISPEMMRAELAGAAKKKADAEHDVKKTMMGVGVIKPSDLYPEPGPAAPATGAKATICGMGIGEILGAQQADEAAAPQQPKPEVKATIAGMGLQDILAAQGGNEPAAAPKPQSEIKATVMGLGLQDILGNKAKPASDSEPPPASVASGSASEVKATVMGLGLQDILRDKDGAPKAAPAAPAPEPEPVPEPAAQKMLVEPAPTPVEYSPGEAAGVALAREMPRLPDDIETLQFLPPTGGLFSLFAYARQARELMDELNDVRGVLQDRRQVLTAHKKAAYRELGRIAWMNKIKIVGIDSYISELSFFKDKLDAIKEQRDAAHAKAAATHGFALEDARKRMAALQFENDRELLWLLELELLQHKTQNLEREIGYLQAVIQRVNKPSTRQNLQNLLGDRQFLLQNANDRTTNLRTRRAAQEEKLPGFKQEYEEWSSLVAAFEAEIAHHVAPLNQEEKEILEKIGPSVEKMGEIIAGSQTARSPNAPVEFRDQVAVTHFIEEWVSRENLYQMKIKDVNGRIDQGRIGQARLFLVSLIVLGAGFAGIFTLLILSLLKII